jgi:DnaJ-class molecular chaperone
VQVLGAYLDRYHDSDWRESSGKNKTKSSGGEMSRAQALEILGLEEESGIQEIKKAHQRLMMQNHPDRGGSTFLASQINHAKDVLLDS